MLLPTPLTMIIWILMLMVDGAMVVLYIVVYIIGTRNIIGDIDRPLRPAQRTSRRSTGMLLPTPPRMTMVILTLMTNGAMTKLYIEICIIGPTVVSRSSNRPHRPAPTTPRQPSEAMNHPVEGKCLSILLILLMNGDMMNSEAMTIQYIMSITVPCNQAPSSRAAGCGVRRRCRG